MVVVDMELSVFTGEFEFDIMCRRTMPVLFFSVVMSWILKRTFVLGVAAVLQ